MKKISKTVTAQRTGGLGKVATKDTETYEKEEIIGYGMEFGTCLDKIAKDVLADKDEVVSIDAWLEYYSDIKNDLLKIN